MAKKLNWKPITDLAIEETTKLGHKLGPFRGHRNPFNTGNEVKTAMCDTCLGCCWIAYSPSKGFGAGGRLLAFKCGTPGASGLKCAEDAQ